MTTEKLYSLLELVDGRVYLNTVDKLKYKMEDNTLFYTVDKNWTWELSASHMDANAKIFKEVKEKKKITMYRHIIYNRSSGHYCQTDWCSNVDRYKHSSIEIIGKPEEKIIEVDCE